jgi:hypothetical protein
MFSSHISAGRIGYRLAFIVLCSLSILLITGCSLPWNRHSNANSKTSSTTPTAQQLLSAVQKNFRAVSAFHVVMQVQNPGKVEQGQIQIRTANGDIGMPDKVKAQATVIMSGQSVTVNLISIGSQQYITDPITGQWRVVKGVLDPRVLTNPDTGIISLISKVQNVSEPTSDTVNGVPCWRITGQLAAKHLAFFTGGGVPANTMLQTNACIGKADSLPYQLIVTGEAAKGDTAQTARTFVMSHYNENVVISAPQI